MNSDTEKSFVKFEKIDKSYDGEVLVVKNLNLDIDRVNLYGGAVSLGHPIGASGARIMCTLLNAMTSKDKKIGVSSICIGGGEALSMLVERVQE